MFSTPLRQAVIYSDFRSRVRVLPLGNAEPSGLGWSIGASSAEWREKAVGERLIDTLVGSGDYSIRI